jgi:hypothetical protein
MRMFDPFFCRYTNDRNVCRGHLGHRIRMICNSGSFLFLLVRTCRSCVHNIKLSNWLSNMATLKIIILVKFWNRFRFSSNPLTSRECCLWIVITIAVVTKIMCLSRRWRVSQVSYGIHNQASSIFTRFGPLKLGFHSNVQSVQNSAAPCFVFKNL